MAEGIEEIVPFPPDQDPFADLASPAVAKDERPAVLRLGPTAPPRDGVEALAFPTAGAPTGVARVAEPPLEVVRSAPAPGVVDGPVAAITATFNRPVVALAAVDSSAA